MAPHSSTLAWKIPWTEKPGGLQSMGSLRVGPDWATSLSLFTFMHWRRKWQPTPVFLPGESQGRGSLVGCRLWGRTESDWSDLAAAAALSNTLWRRRGDAEGTQTQGGSRKWTNLGANCSVTAAQVCAGISVRGWLGRGPRAGGRVEGNVGVLPLPEPSWHSSSSSGPVPAPASAPRKSGHRPGLLRTPGTCAWLNLPGENTGLGKGLMPSVILSSCSWSVRIVCFVQRSWENSLCWM